VPETDEERARPLVSRALERQTVARGVLSARFRQCGLLWTKESFLPYMAALHAVGSYSEKQLSYVAILHGLSQRDTEAHRHDTVEACTPETIAALRASARTLPATPKAE
jgi:hypothetical protein